METESNFEAWMNSTPGRVIVLKMGADGVSRRSEMIASGKVVHLTPVDRKLNQELAASTDLDVFLNGVLQPVRLLEGDESSRELASHPNHLTDTEARELFDGPLEAFIERLSKITNPSAVQRMLDLAEDSSVGATFNQHRLIEERLAAVQGPAMDHVRGSAPARDGRPEVNLDRDGIPHAVTPR